MTTSPRHWPIGSRVRWRPTHEQGVIVERVDDGLFVFWESSGRRDKVAFADPTDMAFLGRVWDKNGKPKVKR